MNNLISFWCAPVTAFFHPDVYRDAAKSPGRRGVLYTLYTTVFSVVIFMILMFAVVLPRTNDFMNWAKQDMPEMVWTPKGLSLENGQTSHIMNYPGYGPVVLFDMTKTDVTEQDMGQAFLFVTQTKVYAKKAMQGNLEIRDITAAGIQAKQQLPPKIRITKEMAGTLFNNVLRAVVVVLPIILLFAFFIFNICSNLFYSLAGLFFNRMKGNKLRYSAVFNLSCFALTASWVLTWLFVLPIFHGLSLPWWAATALNLAYLFYAFKVTDQSSESGNLPA